jgi:hypothetical protein
MFDRNYLYQGMALLVPFILSPVILTGYGASNFGQYSLLITLATFLSYVITMRSEVLISSSATAAEVRRAMSGSLSIGLFVSGLILVVVSISWLLMGKFQLLVVFILAVSLAFFSTINYRIIVIEKFGFTIIQLVKIVVFYSGMLFFLFLTPWPTTETLLISFTISIVLASLCAIRFFDMTRADFVWAGMAGSFYRTKRSFPFLLSSMLGGGRELIMASFMMYQFGSHVVGLYYFSVLYMAKAFIALSTIQSNKIRHSVFNNLNLRPIFREVAFLGSFISFGVVFLILLIDAFGMFSEFDFSLMFSLLPVTFMYLCLMPFTVMYEILELGKVNLYFNLAVITLVFLLSAVTVVFEVGEFYFVLFSSLLWTLVVAVQVAYGILVYSRREKKILRADL